MTADIDAYVSMADVLGVSDKPIHALIVDGASHTTIYLQEIKYIHDGGLIRVELKGYIPVGGNITIPTPKVTQITKPTEREDTTIMED